MASIQPPQESGASSPNATKKRVVVFDSKGYEDPNSEFSLTKMTLW